MFGEGAIFSEHLRTQMIDKYLWKRRYERGEQMSWIDSIAVDERLKKNVLDAKVVRVM